MEIGKRLKEFRKKKKIKMPAIAAATGISKENLYKWEKGTKPSDFGLYNKLVEYLNEMENVPDQVSEDPKLNGAQKTKSSATSFLTGIFLAQDEEPLLLFDNNVAPGTIITINEQPVLIAARIEAPVIGDVDGVIPVTGDSMEPKFRSGNFIAIKKLRFTKILNAGFFYYVVDRNLTGIIRRVRPGGENNSIILSAENSKDYPETTRKMDDVLAIFSIEAVIFK
jgi:phage repressor protein C with HTH and peptisase S24 domain